MRRTRQVFFSIIAVAAAIIITSKLVMTVRPALQDLPSQRSGAVSTLCLERGMAQLPDLRLPDSETPLSAEARDVIPVYTSIGSIYFVGEIFNTGSRPIAKPEVIISLLDESGKRLLFESGYPVHDVIPAYGSVPVVVLVSNPPPVWNSFEVFIQAQAATGKEFMAYTGFVPSDVQIDRDEFDYYVITGDVKNTGESKAEFVQVVASLYDQEGKIVGAANAYIAQTKMDPQGLSSFSVRIMNVSAAPAAYRLQFVGHGK